jgi:hypothetical protein
MGERAGGSRSNGHARVEEDEVVDWEWRVND